MPSKQAQIHIPGKGIVPAALAAALTAGSTIAMLEQFEDNILSVYPDKLAGGIPTYCAGRTDWKAPIGKTFTTDECKEVNKTTLLEYGTAVLGCTKWTQLTPDRLVALTLFAINVGKTGACNSQAVRQINAGNISYGCKLISTKPDGSPNWSYSGGVYVQGLQNRRKIEAALCLKSS